MQIKSANKFIDLYIFTLGFAVIFILTAYFLPNFWWIALLPIFGTILWLVVLKHRFPKSVSIKGNTLTIQYFQAFRTRYEYLSVSDCLFDLDMYTRVVGKRSRREQYYELTISTSNTKWVLTTLEGFQVAAFRSLLSYIQTNKFVN